MIAMMFYRHT